MTTTHVTALNPLDDLSHDHARLSELLFAYRTALHRVASAEACAATMHELGDAAEALRDELFLHFAREEEGLFPFVAEHAPSLVERAEALHREHDEVCRAVEQLCRASLLDPATALAPCQSALVAFESLYARHAESERGFLGAVAALVGPALTPALARILE